MKIQLSDNQNCVVLRTKTGLAVLPTNTEQPFQPFYCSNVGEFRRYMSKEESASLPFAMVALHTPCEVELPNFWRFLWSWKVSDYTSYKPETCSNGGDYTFYERHNIFGRLNAGKLELLDVVRHTTSADFGCDEADGGPQSSPMVEAHFIDCEDSSFTLRTRGYDKYGSQEFSLNQFGQPITWQDAIYYADDEIGLGGWDSPDAEDHIKAQTTKEEMLKRLEILKDTFNWEPPKRR